MITAGRLRFVRSLHCFSQAEMSDLIGIDRSFYAGIETRKKKLPVTVAEAAAERFCVSKGWLLEKEVRPLHRCDLLHVSFPPKRLSLLPTDNEKRRLNDAADSILELLPQFFAVVRLNHVWIGKPSADSAVILGQFSENQFLLLCLNLEVAKDAYGLLMVRLTTLPYTPIAVDPVECDQLKQYSPQFVQRLLGRCGFPADLQESIREQLGKCYFDRFQLEERLQRQTRKLLLDKIVADLDSNDISLSEVKEALEKLGREDLIS